MKWFKRLFGIFVILVFLQIGMVLYYKSTLGGEVTELLQEGNTLLSEGNIDNAEGHYNDALGLLDSLSEKDRQLGSLSAQLGLANVHLVREEYPMTRSLLQENISIYEKIDIPRDVQTCVVGAMTYSNMGLVNIHLGDYEMAKNYLGLAEAEAISISDEEYCTNQLLQSTSSFQSTLSYLLNSNWALLWRNSGNSELAIEFYQKALDLDIIDQEQQHTKGQLGVTYLQEGDFKNAELSIFESQNILALGRLALAKNDHQLAVTYFIEGLKSAQASNKISEQFVCHTGLGLAYEAMGEAKLAEEHFTNARMFTERTLSSLPEEERGSFLAAKMYGFSRSAPIDGLDRLNNS